ncbi:hypothetical protein DER45DRAFT_551734 [Fusarium avenaceum]|nr:hypothetical protein DER45DRAFT_551734 [Fusarium avenaceum]
MVSCERCKQRKAGCDRKHPSCARCEAANVSCEYPPRRKPGFPSGHRRVLESKIETLEAKLKALRTPQTILPQDQSAPLQTASNATSRWPSVGLSNRPSAEADVRPAATWTRTQAIREKKPPPDLVLSLSSLFFRHIHPWLPFLDPRRVFGDVATQDDPNLLCYALFGVSLPFCFDSRLDQTSSDAFWKYSKRRIFVEALEEPSYTSLEALTILTLDLSGMTNGPQTWGALAILTKLAVQLKDASGRSLRVSTEEGLESTVFESRQVSRWRLFWAIYALDCYVTITTGFPSVLLDCHIHHFLPTQTFAWHERQSISTADLGVTASQSPPNSTSNILTPSIIFNHTLDLLALSRKVHAVYVNYRSLNCVNEASLSNWLESWLLCTQELSTWYHGLPDFLSLVSPDLPRAHQGNLPSLIMLHSYYHGLNIHLHGLVAFPSDQYCSSQSFEFQQQSHAACTKSVSHLVEMCSSFHSKIWDKIGWPFAWSLWVAARYLLCSKYNNSPDGSGSGQQLEVLSQSLQDLGKYWQISRKYWRLLRQADKEMGQTDLLPCDAKLPRILKSVVDLSTATCDLEDQYRTDPILYSGEFDPQTSSQQNATSTSFAERDEIEPYLPSATNDGAGQYMFNESNFGIFGSGSDNWFSTPLFASSAFQENPTVTVDEGVGYIQQQ